MMTILSPDTYPFSLEFLPPDAHLVGGAVRDALLQRTKEKLDLDFVTAADAVQVARTLAHHYQAGFVVLDADRKIARVVFDGVTVDFAQQEGDTLETDLRRRDFTVNAIAYNPRTSTFIDPLNGCADLQQRIMRMVSAKNLNDDPLRLLRAYRQAAQLNFTLEPVTQATIRELAPQLSRIAAERIHTELNYLFNSSTGTPLLKLAWEDGLSPFILHDQVTFVKIEKLAQVDSIFEELSTHCPELQSLLTSPLPGIATETSVSYLAVAKLASLLDLKVTYTRNSQVKTVAVELFLAELKYSNAEIKAVKVALENLPLLHQQPLSIRDQYFWFKKVGNLFPMLAVMARLEGIPVELILPFIHRYLNPQDPIAYPVNLVTGNDLMTALNLPKGKEIGRLLTELQIARAEGRIKTPPEALKLADQLKT